MTHTIINAQVATANINSEAFDMDGQRAGRNLSFQVNATGFNASDATVKMQHSNDNSGSNWFDITDASLTMASGTTSQILAPISLLGSRYYRIVYTKNSNSAGTITVILNIQ